MSTTGKRALSVAGTKSRMCKEKSEKGRYRYGVGMALCSHTTSFYPYQTEVASAAISGFRMTEKLAVHVPIHDHGCGTVMAMKKIAREILQVKLDRITLNEADTENMPYDYGCYAVQYIHWDGRSKNAVRNCWESKDGSGRSIRMQTIRFYMKMESSFPNQIWIDV